MEIKARTSLALCLLLGLSFVLSSPTWAKGNLWQDVRSLSEKSAKSKKSEELLGSKNSGSAYQKARILNLDVQQMNTRLVSTHIVGRSLQAKKISSSNPPIKIELPLPDGRLITVSVIEDNILPSGLSSKFSQIKMFKVIPDDLIASGKLDMTENGFHAMLLTRQGESIFIDPVGNSTYVSYRKSDQKSDHDAPFSCSVHPKSTKLNGDLSKKLLQSKAAIPSTRTQKSFLTYRIAIAATGEYTAKYGGTVAGALSAIATTLSRVNQVYEQDLGIHLTLVENNDKLIYVDADSDPYTGSDSKQHIYQNQANIDALIGSENYDIGHLFTTRGGGLAAVAGACNRYRKAQGISGISNPKNDSFNIDFVAHEIGHQLGATHTFNGVQGLCAGNTRTANTAYEPGSGSTIMSYAGYCGQDNLQSNADAMFHIGSIRQIRSFVTLDKNSTCGIDNNIINTSPKVEAGVNHVIPAQTPFELVGEATDAEGDALIYAWQQIDAGELSPVNSDRGDNAIFRVHPLSSNKSRSFPPLQNLLNNSSQRGESLPIQQRLMQFRLVVQDSYNTTQSDAMSVLVQRTGSRFALNLPRSQYSLGETHKVLWNVAGTDKVPVNCSSVDISLSVDGGYNFDQLLGEDLPNTGEAWVTIPATSPSTSQGRFKIRCSDNIFFAVSYRNFAVNSQNHAARLILSDEDQPENDLADVDLSKIDFTKYAEPTSSEAGGVFDGLFFLLFLAAAMGFKFRRIAMLV